MVDRPPTLDNASPFRQYQPHGGRYDEYHAQDGTTRASWQPIAAHFDQIGTEGLARLATDADRMLRDSGATFQSTGEDGTHNRPWQLSCVPFVIDAATWRRIETGIHQRVRLLEAVLADLLGPRQLIRDGTLPAELLYANAEYSRAFHGLPTGGRQRLHVTAIDLSRDPAGNWCVLGHRSRAPSGLGYALENRVVTSRLLQKLMLESNVPRLANFFVQLREHLRSLAPTHQNNPRIAILTPGQASYRYFEDVYLAKYLGYTLVQGRDLAVRGDRLHLKTLGGLQPIEVVWRHISDRKSDSLELDPHVHQGVAGMLRTVRAGNLAVVNDIGSVLAEMPALLPFLPAVARVIGGEDLVLPSIESYWCGSSQQRSHVLANLEDYLIRPAFSIAASPPADASRLSAAAREELVAEIRARPHQYVAQAKPSRSTTPVWHQQKLESWAVAFRTFQLQTAAGIEVMPGGLVRVGRDGDSLNGNPRSGHLGQDCWILAEAAEPAPVSLLQPYQTTTIIRSGEDLPSRVAEQFYWLGRYVERADSIAKLLRTTLTRLAGEDEWEHLPDIPPLVKALAAVGQIEPDYAISDFGVSARRLEQLLPRTVFDLTPRRGIRAATKSAVANAMAVRDRLSGDGYRILIRLEQAFVGSPYSAVSAEAAIAAINRLIADLMAVAGLMNETMTRSHAWSFLQLGRRVERTIQTAEVLLATLVETVEPEAPVFESVLNSRDSLMSYRSRYLAQLQPHAVLDLLITDDTNPRSILFQLSRIKAIIDGLPDRKQPRLEPDQRLAESLLYQTRMIDPQRVARVDDQGVRSGLLSYLTGMVNDIPKLSDAITAKYLLHTGTQEITGSVIAPQA